MKAVIMDGPQTMRVGDWATPEPESGEVVVQVGAVGICVGDLHIYRGVSPYAIYPVIGGHEISGVVAAVGEGVTDWKVGDRVAVEPFLGCGKCYPCRIGKSNCCANLTIIGVHRPGGFADYVTAPANHVYRVPDGLSLTLASSVLGTAIARWSSP